jgi:type III secretion system FlhB-like substrate exporter
MMRRAFLPKRILLFGVLAAPLLQASIPYYRAVSCDTVAEVAKDIMAARQSGIPQYEAAHLAYRLNDENLEDSIVADAYRWTRERSRKEAKSAVVRFEKAYHAICFAEHIGLIRHPSGMSTGLSLFANLDPLPVR